jgi:hypothetical protein
MEWRCHSGRHRLLRLQQHPKQLGLAYPYDWTGILLYRRHVLGLVPSRGG